MITRQLATTFWFQTHSYVFDSPPNVLDPQADPDFLRVELGGEHAGVKTTINIDLH